MVLAVERLDKCGQDGHGGVGLHLLDALGAPQTHANEEDCTPY